MGSGRKGYSYIRFSTPEQARGDSYRRQLEMAQRYAASHNIELDTSLDLNDLGVSAYMGANATSGKLALFFEAVDSGRVAKGSVLIVEALDRLSRTEPADSFIQLVTLLKKDISIVDLSNDIEYTKNNINDLRNLIMTMLSMVIAREKSTKGAERVAAARDRNRERARDSGYILTRNVPRWLHVVGDKIVPIQDHVVLVKRLFQMSLGGVGSDLIAKTLNKERIPPFGRGAGWQMSTVRKILHHRGLIGEFTPTQLVDGKYVDLEPIPNYFPKIIDEQLFYAVQKAITSRTLKGGEVGESVNLFTHIIKCYHCGSSLYRIYRGAANRNRASFVCDWGRSGVNDCGVKPWRVDDIEQKILKDVTEVDLAQVLGSDSSERIETLRLQLTGSQGKLADAEERLKRLVELVEQGAHVPSVVRRITQLDAEIVSLTDQCVLLEKELGLERLSLDTAEVKQAGVIELMGVIQDRDVRLRLKGQLQALIGQIDVDLVDRKIIIWYEGPPETRKSRWIENGQSSVFVLDDDPADWA